MIQKGACRLETSLRHSEMHNPEKEPTSDQSVFSMVTRGIALRGAVPASIELQTPVHRALRM